MSPSGFGDSATPASAEEGLAAAILGGPAIAVFENLYAAYAAEGRRTAQGILRDPALAEDAVHTGFIEVFRLILSGHRWNDPDAARAAVLRNTRWAALNVLRRRRRRPEHELAAAEASDPGGWARAEATALCEQIVEGLRPSYREALHLRYIVGCSNAQAAQAIGVSVHAFEVRVSRALRAARRSLRGVPLGAGIAPRLQRLRERSGDVMKRRRPSARRPPRRLHIPATALGLTSLSLLGVAMTGPTPPEPPVHPVAAARVVPAAADALDAQPRPDTPLVDEATILDAAVVTSAGRTTVLMVGLGRRCNCWETFRSDDGGETWSAAALPRGGRPTTGVQGAQHPIACAADAQGWSCAGRRLTPPAELSGLPARALDIGAGRWLVLRRFGGVLCSTDAGLTWGTRCPAG